MAKNASTHIFYDHPFKYYVKMCRKINKIVATRLQILRIKCTKFDFGSRPHWGSLECSPDLLAKFKGVLLLRGKKERERKGRQKGGERGKGEKRGEGEGRGKGEGWPFFQIPEYATGAMHS